MTLFFAALHTSARAVSIAGDIGGQRGRRGGAAAGRVSEVVGLGAYRAWKRPLVTRTVTQQPLRMDVRWPGGGQCRQNRRTALATRQRSSYPGPATRSIEPLSATPHPGARAARAWYHIDLGVRGRGPNWLRRLPAITASISPDRLLRL